jgi:MFS family permease
VSPTFASLGIRNYRRYAAGALISNTGTWMQRVAQDWLVLTVLTDHSATAVGITTGLQFAPVLLLSPWSGLIADRVSRRALMIVTQVVGGLLALLLGVLVLTGVAELWHVYLLAAALGVSSALEAPARQTFVSELVPAERLANAVGLNSASFHAGRLIGPALAGLLIAAFGTGPVFLINAATFAATIWALAGLRVRELITAPRAPRSKGQIRAGLGYVRRRPDLLVVMGVVGMVGTFGLNFQLTTAVMATQVYGKGAGEYGLLGSVMAIGSLGGALLAARRQNPRLRLFLAATAAFGVSALIASLMPSYLTFAIALVPTGLSALTLMTAANTIVQLSTAPQMRGRVMALYMAVFMGGTPVGSPLIGWIGANVGARWTIALGGIVSLACAVIAFAVLIRVQRRQLVFDRRRPTARLISPSRRRVATPTPAPVGAGERSDTLAR